MATNDSSSEQAEPRRYRVQCEDCALERTAEGRPEVERVATSHRDETGHALVAVEWPA